MKITYVKRNDIDTAKWDSCIAHSVNGIVYGYSWYLDIVAENWDALIGDDYKAVFPLTYNTKFGISYLYQPFFTQQLGLFSLGLINHKLVGEFLDAIPPKFRFISISLNTFLKFDYPKAKVSQRVTYHLDLIEPYATISSRYSSNTKRNISKAVAYNVLVHKGLGALKLLELKKGNQMVPLKQKHFDMLTKLITQAVAKGVGEVLGAYDMHNELCAGALFLKSNGKVIYLLASSTEEGKNVRAMFALIDHYIHQNADSHLVLDFEGSNIDSIARFYSGFGATPCEYNHLIVNKLPWYIKLFRQ
ncbi:MAG: hypothetical protein PHD06_05705 [Bacteroidales bacterium]|nr:hypothetical protein [Bacteroidales bacterium]MDD4384658.1 hypothetical protein [Bacteroidales bacterium]MDY0197098.1 hypothetical protein [Tenuifilaceae bacterium]